MSNLWFSALCFQKFPNPPTSMMDWTEEGKRGHFQAYKKPIHPFVKALVKVSLILFLFGEHWIYNHQVEMLGYMSFHQCLWTGSEPQGVTLSHNGGI